MAEYINREVLKNDIAKSTEPFNTGSVFRAINRQIAADVVPVVRCWECKHHRDKNEQERKYLVEDILICTSPDATEDCWNAVWPDHFCSYGERKEGDN